MATPVAGVGVPEEPRKRARVAPITADDVIYFARIIMESDPFKDRAPREEDRAFRALFGCGVHLVLILWNKLSSCDLIPKDGLVTHLLWTLMYCKQYGKWKTMRKLTKTDPKTLRKWIALFYDAIELIEPLVVGDSVDTFSFLCWRRGLDD
jgi:hypothetical protein